MLAFVYPSNNFLVIEETMTDSVNCEGKEVVHHIHHINGIPLPPFVTQHQLDSMKEVE